MKTISVKIMMPAFKPKDENKCKICSLSLQDIYGMDSLTGDRFKLSDLI